MTKIKQYLDKNKDQDININWSCSPWIVAQPALAWLGIAPEIDKPPSSSVSLADIDIKLICDRMMLHFLNDSNQIVWSSHMLHTAIKAVIWMTKESPEPLLKSIWEFLLERELDKNVYEFCRAIGNEIRMYQSHYDTIDWDLTWMQSHATPSQACLRYWILAVKPELWEGETESITMNILQEYPFLF